MYLQIHIDNILENEQTKANNDNANKNGDNVQNKIVKIKTTKQEISNFKCLAEYYEFGTYSNLCEVNFHKEFTENPKIAFKNNFKFNYNKLCN